MERSLLLWKSLSIRRIPTSLRKLGYLGCLIAIGLSTSVSADEIVLKTGQKLEGEVLKERPEELVIDIGIDIIRVPLSQIEQRTTSQPPPPPSRNQDLFQMADLPLRSVKDLAQDFGEGVVLIQTPGGLGSGFILSEQGHCVTNYHVVEKETKIAVTIFHKDEAGQLSRRRIEEIKILALNPYFDLALLQIPQQSDLKFKIVYVARNHDLREGDPVFAIGSPLGLERSVSEGIVSARNRDFEGLTYIQTTAQINPGNSGGPLFNLRGEVVGVINMKLAFGEGLGFAIPVPILKLFLANQDAFAFDKHNSNTGYRYLDPPRRRNREKPPIPTADMNP